MLVLATQNTRFLPFRSLRPTWACLCVHARLIGFPFSDTPSWVFEISFCFRYLDTVEHEARVRVRKRARGWSMWAGRYFDYALATLGSSGDRWMLKLKGVRCRERRSTEETVRFISIRLLSTFGNCIPINGLILFFSQVWFYVILLHCMYQWQIM